MTDPSPDTAPNAAAPIVVIMDGGLIRDIVSAEPNRKVIVVNIDADDVAGAEPAELTALVVDGRLVTALVSDIDLVEADTMLAGFAEGRAAGYW